jgi:hypothetical protein
MVTPGTRTIQALTSFAGSGPTHTACTRLFCFITVNEDWARVRKVWSDHQLEVAFVVETAGVIILVAVYVYVHVVHHTCHPCKSTIAMHLYANPNPLVIPDVAPLPVPFRLGFLISTPAKGQIFFVCCAFGEHWATCQVASTRQAHQRSVHCQTGGTCGCASMQPAGMHDGSSHCMHCIRVP